MSDLSGLILDATTSLEVDLTGAVATNQLPFVVCYVVLNKSTLTPVDDGATTETGQTNNTTAVTMLAAPAANTKRVLKYLSLKNSDTAAVEPWIQINDNTTLREIIKPTLAVGDSIIFTPENGFYVVDSTGRLKTTGGVNGPGSSTDNAIVRWNGTAGNSIQDASNATISDAGQLALTVTGSAGGILIGGDAQWYRSAADVMRTPDSLTVDGNLTVSGTKVQTAGNVTVTGALGDDVASSIRLSYFSGGKLYVQGANASTNGIFSVQSTRSDGSNSLVFLGFTVAGAVSIQSPPAFVASDKYLVIDASGNIHVSALGPAS